MTPRRALLPLALAALASFGCSATTYQTVPMPDLENETPAPGTSRAYIARSGQMTGSVRKVELRADGELVAVLGTTAFVCLERPAKRRVVQVIYDGPVVDRRLDGRKVEDVLAYEGVAGETYWFRLHLDPKTKMPIIDQLDEESGRALMAGRKPAVVR